MELTPASLSKYLLSLLLAKGKQGKGGQLKAALTPPSPEVRAESTGFEQLFIKEKETAVLSTPAWVGQTGIRNAGLYLGHSEWQFWMNSHEPL